MSLFAPRTFSTDWELIVVDRLDRCVSTRHLMGFAGILDAELGLPIIVDKESLELPLGVNDTFDMLWERIRRVTDRATELLRACGLDLYPAAAHPVERIACAAHVHVGTLLDESAGIRLENALLPYMPAFAALAANSPAAFGLRGACKSYRVRYNALENIRPGMWRDPRAAQHVWGDDITPKLDLVPTLEARIIDCTSSRRLLAELATLVAAFVHTWGDRVEDMPLDAGAYREYLINRWCAARAGLQATFRWQDRPRPAADLLDEMLDACAEGLAALGASRAGLPLISGMIAKRVCQADMVWPLLERYPDPYLFANAYGKMLRHWEWFDEYLDQARPLDPVSALSEADIRAEHLKVIGENAPLYRTREAMAFPPPEADAVLAQLVREGLVATECTLARGLRLSRLPEKGAGHA